MNEPEINHDLLLDSQKYIKYIQKYIPEMITGV